MLQGLRFGKRTGTLEVPPERRARRVAGGLRPCPAGDLDGFGPDIREPPTDGAPIASMPKQMARGASFFGLPPRGWCIRVLHVEPIGPTFSPHRRWDRNRHPAVNRRLRRSTAACGDTQRALRSTLARPAIPTLANGGSAPRGHATGDRPVRINQWLEPTMTTTSVGSGS